MKKLLSVFIAIIWLSLMIAVGEEPYKGYRGYIDFELGDEYNFNTSQLINFNNMQLYSVLSSSHGFQLKNWYVGGGVGYYHSFRDKENMFPLFVACEYSFGKDRMNPIIDTRVGIIYDRYWIQRVQAYGSVGVNYYMRKGFQMGIRLTLFSRPSRFFTANAAFVLRYVIR